jgi:sulfatase maturation enzyme AslB (radical SAM superfamily)
METLSKKRKELFIQKGVRMFPIKTYPEEDVKETIKKLDEDFLEDWVKADGKTFTLDEIRKIIKRRFGEDLI